MTLRAYPVPLLVWELVKLLPWLTLDSVSPATWDESPLPSQENLWSHLPTQAQPQARLSLLLLSHALSHPHLPSFFSDSASVLLLLSKTLFFQAALVSPSFLGTASLASFILIKCDDAESAWLGISLSTPENCTLLSKGLLLRLRFFRWGGLNAPFLSPSFLCGLTAGGSKGWR